MHACPLAVLTLFLVQVYRGIDQCTGAVVALKEVSLEGLSQAEVEAVQSEVDLLRRLRHRNVVEYLGSVKSGSSLYIVLEFVEAGSLGAMVKPSRCGALPESLVAVYTTQVLEGLVRGVNLRSVFDSCSCRPQSLASLVIAVSCFG